MKELFVTLKMSRNCGLQYPLKGWLELFEIGTDGSIIKGVFRNLNDDGTAGAPVVTDKPLFEYIPSETRYRPNGDGRRQPVP